MINELDNTVIVVECARPLEWRDHSGQEEIHKIKHSLCLQNMQQHVQAHTDTNILALFAKYIKFP